MYPLGWLQFYPPTTILLQCPRQAVVRVSWFQIITELKIIKYYFHLQIMWIMKRQRLVCPEESVKLYTTSVSPVTNSPGEWDFHVVMFSDKSNAIGSFHVTCLPPMLAKSEGHWKTSGGTVSTEILKNIFIYVIQILESKRLLVNVVRFLEIISSGNIFQKSHHESIVLQKKWTQPFPALKQRGQSIIWTMLI